MSDGLTVNERIRRARKERGLPQTALIGDRCSHAYISRIEANLRRPSVRVIRDIADRLEVDAVWLETGQKSSTIVVEEKPNGWAVPVSLETMFAIMKFPIEIRLTELEPTTNQEV